MGSGAVGGMPCDGCGVPSRLALALALAMAVAAPGGGRFCWTCRRGWDDAAAGRFLAAARALFPGSVEVDKNGEPLPLEQLEFDLTSDASPGNTSISIERSKRMATTKTRPAANIEEETWAI